ncbi:MAG: hypothetical protein CL609_09555 [Anaerolineaceae bacterium]|nr:hypothetical protein [Anaerolineaceae bacterium]
MFQEYEISPRLLKKEKLQRCSLGNCKGACCLYGVWLGKYEQEQILRYWDEISVFMPDGYRENPSLCFQNELEKDPFVSSGKVVHSLVVKDSAHYGGTACVFLNQDHKCALQCAAENMGHHPWFLKPFYCILHPLDLDDEGRITLDETNLLAEEPGSCLRPAPTDKSLLVTFEEELRYFLGNDAYERLLR